MEHMMSIADILDALYDGIGCTWCEEGRSFVDEVAAWVRDNTPEDDECWEDDREDG